MIAIIGDVGVDLVALNLRALPAWGEDRPVSAIEQRLGGSAMNVATNLAALGNEVALLAGVGRDRWGDWLRQGAQAAGVNVDGFRALDAPSAVTMVLSGAGDRAFVSVYGATAALAESDLDPTLLARARHVHLCGLWQSTALLPALPALCRALRARGVTVSLDTNVDPQGRWGAPLPELLGCVDAFLPSEVEALGVTGAATPEAALEALARQVPLVALKLGAAGARVRQGEQAWSAPAFAVPVVDTTGAGDAFAAGFLHGWLRGWPMEATLRLATATGALAVARVGGSEGAPTLAQVERFMAQGS